LKASRVGLHEKVRAPEQDARLMELRRFQSQRLKDTYADLTSDSRYGPACRFFLSDLYSEDDFSQRDHDIRKIYDSMKRVLPPGLLHIIQLSLELAALTESLDRRLVEELRGPLDRETYAEAYRLSFDDGDRRRQIDLVVEVGKAVDAVLQNPAAGIALKVAHFPSRLAGWGELQGFLERGYTAFKHLGGADKFLEIIRTREIEFMNATLGRSTS
jgi:hypothetical protein